MHGSYILIYLDFALQPRNEHVKLHVTLMNSRFNEYKSSINEHSRNQAHLTFDARKIFEVSKQKIIKFNYYYSLTKYLYSR